jgi:F0F1-type ATP synthase delta subunit
MPNTKFMFSSKLIAKTLYSMVADDGRSADTVAGNLWAFLKRHHMLALAPRVVGYIEFEHRRRMKDARLGIFAAFPLGGDLEREIKKFVNVPQDTAVEVAVDKALIGGFTARWKGQVYDTSIKTRLARLREHLVK